MSNFNHRNICFILLVVLIFSINIKCFANIKSTHSIELAEELSTIMHVDDFAVNKKIDEVKTLAEAIKNSKRNELINGTDQDLDLQIMSEKLIALYDSKGYREYIYNMYVDLLIENFTNEEIKSMINFYNSPVGQQVLIKENKHYNEMNVVMMNLVNDLCKNEDIYEAIHNDYVQLISAEFDKNRVR